MAQRNMLTSLAGAPELLAATRKLADVVATEQQVKLGDVTIVLRVPAMDGSKQAPIYDGPVGFYHVELVHENLPTRTYALAGGVIVLCDPIDSPPLQPGWKKWTLMNGGVREVPQVVLAPNTAAIALTDALGKLPIAPEAVLLVINGERYSTDALLNDSLESAQSLLNALFAVCKQFYGSIQDGKTRVAVVVCQAWVSDDVLRPITGLFGGFIKSLARDLPKAHVAALHTDKALSEILSAAELAFADRQDGMLPELFERGEVISRAKLAQTPAITQSGSAPFMAEGMVVLATGGARGVTAVLIEDMVSRYRCKVVALGRTTLDATPTELLEMDEQVIVAYESQFYREALVRGNKRNIVELKREFQRHLAANEIFQNCKRMRALGGDIDYMVADITKESDVEHVVAEVLARHGHIDLVIHGAGTQISRVMTGKNIAEFDSVVAAKLNGLRNLYSSLARRGVEKKIYFHLLTSSFSFWGNDGQPDYGAANEAMNRLADAMTAAGGRWSSLAWLGWAGIGMTRGSEYAALAEQRGLYPVTKREGQQLFSALMCGIPTHAANILATPKEIAFYRVPVTANHDAQPIVSSARIEPIELSLERASYLRQHLVAGVPTVPGAIELMYAVRLASLEIVVNGDLKPPKYGGKAQFDTVGSGIEVLNARFLSFLKSYPDRSNHAHVIVKSDPSASCAYVVIESDFKHPSGRVLRTCVRNFEAQVKLVNQLPAIPAQAIAVTKEAPGFMLLDPYIHGMGNVALSGIFDCLRNITVNDLGQVATFELSPELRDEPQAELIAPAVLLDALWRLAVMRPVGSRIPLYVPVESRSVVLWLGDGNVLERMTNAHLFATRPEPITGEDGAVVIRYAVALDAGGIPLVVNANILAKASS